ncbi:MAG TPA: hypothetical protein VKU77_26700 [Streptosporangiaceae bacterium]|nr:hypothetical protein [Streptosporangiaceae bacterium]
MKNTHKRWGLFAGLILVAGSLLAMTPMAASAAQPPNACSLSPRDGHIAGIVLAAGPCTNGAAGAISRAAAIPASDPAKGTPPLLFHGGPVMMTPSTGPLIVTPIFWNPAGDRMSLAYKVVILKYLLAVTLASGQNSNVFSTLNEYSGTNGQIHYQVRLGLPVNDTDPLPASGCTVASTDTANIYGDGSGYNACLDDAQLQTEIGHVTAARGLPHNLSHIYVLYTPKHIESCFFSGSTTTAANACTINFQPSAAYCAYHSEATSSAIYANMPFPIYDSATKFTCGTEKNFGTIESPNGNKDADVEISPTSHEISESITDPDTATGWYDSSGFENGDECAYIFGATQGTAGHLYNQVIAGFHFLTQEEFGNKDFALTGGGCVQSASAEA